ncbi:MAG: UvrD-helicase domain-containing protein [Oscillospiraceae bacterium]|jgi:DNA helicase-2/ATP-dependent DNA helicase PcrA|nr:UvrD-helicase domain-containing protein [Oscillospiraceae bacterium]
MNYNEIKMQALNTFFARSNPAQREAIFTVAGPLLIIAGAGSGKTTVLVNRIANMLLFGDAANQSDDKNLSADDAAFLERFANGEETRSAENTERLSDIIGGKQRVAPWRILAVTFTNKAAKELRERIERIGSFLHASDIWAMTFHSCCVRMLRRDINRLGFTPNFAIYDADDSQRMIKAIMKDLGTDESQIQPKMVQTAISRAKDKLINADNFETTKYGKRDYTLETVSKIYSEYQRRLKNANALDFDDIIALTVELFDRFPDVLAYWQDKFQYVMVDEYQDTNEAQFRLVSMLSAKHGNLCAVGDEDQSIYKFRGATIENILSFENQFSATVIKLEQNYRSTSNILNAANSVIAKNTSRKGKTLWSDKGEGHKIDVVCFTNETEESSYISDNIKTEVAAGGNYKDYALLYRSHAQSRSIEQALVRDEVPYRVIGGTKFYDRKEIKDILAYLSVIANPFDIVRFRRIANVPKRRIGDATQAEIEHVALATGQTPIDVMTRSGGYQTLAKSAKLLVPLAEMFNGLLAAYNEHISLTELIDHVLDSTGYRAMLEEEEAQGLSGISRLENIEELKSAVLSFTEANPESGLEEYLEQAALWAEADDDNGDDRVTLMTIHGAKGLEFNTVYLIGAEDNLFPSYRSMGDTDELEEERRLAYVAITRAKTKLFITHARQRLYFGQTQRNKLSRFVRDIPEEYVESIDKSLVKSPHQGINFANPKNRIRTGYLQKEKESHEKLVESTKPGTNGDGDYSAGERVKHRIFGDGTVLTGEAMGGDLLLEIAFDSVGTKKLMANFAKITKL